MESVSEDDIREWERRKGARPYTCLTLLFPFIPFIFAALIVCFVKKHLRRDSTRNKSNSEDSGEKSKSKQSLKLAFIFSLSLSLSPLSLSLSLSLYRAAGMSSSASPGDMWIF